MPLALFSAGQVKSPTIAPNFVHGHYFRIGNSCEVRNGCDQQGDCPS